MRLLLLFSLLFVCAYAAEPAYVGANTCSQCHRAIAVPQSKSNMGVTWQGATSSLLPPGYRRHKVEAGVEYHFAQKGAAIEYGVQMPDRPGFTARVETIVGGKRHGLSFLVRVSEIQGIKLDNAPLVETRYLHYSPTGQLVLSPGFPEQAPASWETAIGRVLSPDFEQKCLNCHGAAQRSSHETGVRCESCHGPGSEHLKAVQSNTSAKAILNPGKMSNTQQLQICSQCHSGFSDIQDPVPDDLLISSQVTALQKSQCFIQSGAGLTCTTCHDPHHDASKEDKPKAVKACQSCHGETVRNRAAVCPVNRIGDCVQCHMTEAQKGSFHMADHWIRVHPEQSGKAPRQDVTLRTQVTPKHLYLRWILTDDNAKAEAAHAELVAGTPFFVVAQKYSTDRSKISGGFLGDMAVADMDPSLATAALKIERGEFSPVVDLKGKHAIIYRMSRDYLYDAERVHLEANHFRESRLLTEASQKYIESLQIYPYFLRSLIFLAVTLGEQGNPARAAGVLELAAQLYPKDPAAFYNLGLAYNALGRTPDEIKAYQRAIDQQVDLIPAYLNLGSTLYSAGRLDEALDVFGRGLKQNPLSADLYFNLSQVYGQQGNKTEAKRALAVAAAIDPKFAKGAGQ